MKTKMFNAEGSHGKEIELPEFFSQPIREDLVLKFLEARKTNQPYAPSLVAGRQYSAAGKAVHRRHVWRSGYGRGQSRIPRKILSRRGSQFNWVGAEVPSTRGGRRAHPPKVVAMINTKKINKKEMNKAIVSALSSTASKRYVASKYKSLEEKDFKDLPFIVESGIFKLKTKEILSAFKKIFGEKLFNVALRKKNVRAGRGKLRGRKYKKSAGVLLVTGNKENLKTNAFEVRKVENLSINDLSKGGLGRLTVYTENAINELKQKLKEK